MTFAKLDTSSILNVKVASMAATYETRIKSDGKIEATDTITKLNYN